MDMSDTFRLFFDTSVFGGYHDQEFAEETRQLFHYARTGRITIVISDAIIRELERAPVDVKQLLHDFKDFIEVVAIDARMYALAEKYVAGGIIPLKWSDDALHVATATIVETDAIVSWNFKHLVRFDRIRAFNQVNFAGGYGMVTIISPKEAELSDD
ncbi:MAG: hypothetical protein RDV48_24060 [Candidatus Eremiobacteraeota bacterium]|nr:hypothetical protein [Candidatus Eremiobacteraeota bacterium]